MPIGQGALDGPEALDGHPVDLEDLRPQQVEEMVPGQPDPQLVDHGAVAPLEDLDGPHVAADRADPAGHRPQRSGSVGQVQSDQVVDHPIRLGRDCVRTVSG